MSVSNGVVGTKKDATIRSKKLGRKKKKKKKAGWLVSVVCVGKRTCVHRPDESSPWWFAIAAFAHPWRWVIQPWLVYIRSDYQRATIGRTRDFRPPRNRSFVISWCAPACAYFSIGRSLRPPPLFPILSPYDLSSFIRKTQTGLSSPSIHNTYTGCR